MGRVRPVRGKFEYETRQPSDRASSYMAGGLIEQSARLKRISTSSKGIALRSYKLNYLEPVSGEEVSLYGSRSVLQTVTQCSKEDVPAQRRAAKFA